MTDMADWEVAEKAADYIDNAGFNQGEFLNQVTGAACAVGAIGVVSGYSFNNFSGDVDWEEMGSNPTVRKFHRYLSDENMIPFYACKNDDDSCWGIASFNDQGTRAYAQPIVTQALRDFAIKVRPDDAR